MKRLDDEVRRLMDASGKSNKELADICEMTPSWVSLLRRGYIKAPNGLALQCLYEALANRPLIE